MNDDNDSILDFVEKMIFQCNSFRKIIPPDNTQAKLLVSNFYEQLNILKNIIGNQETNELKSEDSPFTNREFEILEHVANGYTNKEIASALSISHKTVEYHISSIFNKTHSSSRVEAIKNAIKSGWLKV